LFAFGDDLDVAIAQVPANARKMQFVRAILRKVPKAHSLHPALNHSAETLLLTQPQAL
jgi:hypothetical protein